MKKVIMRITSKLISGVSLRKWLAHQGKNPYQLMIEDNFHNGYNLDAEPCIASQPKLKTHPKVSLENVSSGMVANSQFSLVDGGIQLCQISNISFLGFESNGDQGPQSQCQVPYWYIASLI